MSRLWWILAWGLCFGCGEKKEAVPAKERSAAARLDELHPTADQPDPADLPSSAWDVEPRDDQGPRQHRISARVRQHSTQSKTFA